MEQAYYKSDVGNLCVVTENHEVTRIFLWMKSKKILRRPLH
jgi:hypothetical protein